jgi:hypothetical protein
VKPDYCPLVYTVTQTTFNDNEGTPEQTAIENAVSNDDPHGLDFKFFWDKDNSPLDNTQTVTVKATSTSIYDLINDPISEEDDFDLNAVSPCGNSALVTIEKTDQTMPDVDNYSGI